MSEAVENKKTTNKSGGSEKKNMNTENAKKSATENKTKNVKKVNSLENISKGAVKSTVKSETTGKMPNKSSSKVSDKSQSGANSKATSNAQNKKVKKETDKGTDDNANKDVNKKSANKGVNKGTYKDENKDVNKKQNQNPKNKTQAKTSSKKVNQDTAKKEKIEKEKVKKTTNKNTKEKDETTEENKTNSEDIDESKFNTVSLKEIREALQNKVNDNQKQSVVKKVLTDIGIAMIMIIYLILVMLATKNIEEVVLEKDLKIITLGILVLGIFLLERAYKKDNSRLAINAVEILIFGASNLCLIYAIKLYFGNIINIITYIGAVTAGYYILKSIILSIKNVRKYKKENNDIKEIIKK